MSSSKYLPLRLVVCLQIVLFAAVYAGGDRQRYCGPTLTQMLQILCKNSYASPTYNNKRSGKIFHVYDWQNIFLIPIAVLDNGDDNEYINDELLTYPRFAYQPYPFGGQFESTGMRVRRDYEAVKRGVYDECCRNACTLRQLMSYCAAWTKDNIDWLLAAYLNWHLQIITAEWIYFNLSFENVFCFVYAIVL